HLLRPDILSHPRHGTAARRRLPVNVEPVAHVLAVYHRDYDRAPVVEIDSVLSDGRVILHKQAAARLVRTASEAGGMQDVKPGNGPTDSDSLDLGRPILKGCAAKLDE